MSSCGSTRPPSAGPDLHILKGDVPAVHEGSILGHEAAGTAWEAGEPSAVRNTAESTGSPGGHGLT
jgi:hypothetical protein